MSLKLKHQVAGRGMKVPDCGISAVSTAPLPTSESGFTLLEVLVAILILSFGLLGLAGIQTVVLRNNHTSYLRTQASQQASDMADRMRANLAGLSNYNFTSTPSDPGCISSGCTPAQMEQYDAYEWTTYLATTLPSGTGSVKQGAASGVTDCAGSAITDTAFYVITVNWVETNKGTPATKCFALSVRPQ